MEEAESGCLSAVSLQEALMVLAARRGDKAAWVPLERIINDLELEVVAHSAELARIAGEAFLRFGKGRHPARLNCGDCASYALARFRNIPLLFKGADFTRTDIVPVLRAPA
jgi:ribonuclease VapC